MELLVEFLFPAAHRLPRHPGKCHRMHGHTYKLQVMVEGVPDSTTGLVIDFFDIEAAAGPVVAEVRDTCLNDVLENPTAEAIVAYLWDRIVPELPALSALRLWETDACCVTYRGEPLPAALLTPGAPGIHPSTAP
jgi:6-pyruvoyltetrahydropterin/6-carboxytetrahydropterin synthase